MNKKLLVLLNTFTLLLMLYANFGSFVKIFSNETVASISYKYNTMFAPAGYAFSIWSIIFTFCIGFVVYQFHLLQTIDPNQFILRTGIWFSIGNLSNALWVYCWTNEMLGYAVVLIFILLISLVKLMLNYFSLNDNKNLKTRLLVWWPVTIYLGWIIVATVACVAAWLVYLGCNVGKLTEENLTIMMIFIGCGLYLILIRKYNLISTTLVGVWAFTAIAVRHWGKINSIAWVAITATILLIAAISINNFLSKKSKDYTD